MPTDSRKNRAGLPDFSDFPSLEKGTVWLVGAGPGAPGLLTLLASHAIGSADVIIHDALVGPGILELAPDGCTLIFAGKRGGMPSAEQDDICDLMIAEARKGHRVVRLKGGDPFMFGRGAEECLKLSAAGIPFRVVPGISAGIGGLAYAGIPVTHRTTNHSVLFLTGHDRQGLVPSAVDWNGVARAAPVIVMYMALKHLGDIADRLIAAGRSSSDPLAIVSNATLPDQKVRRGTLGTVRTMLRAQGIAPPAIIVAGPVVELGERIHWYRDRLRSNGNG